MYGPKHCPHPLCHWPECRRAGPWRAAQHLHRYCPRVILWSNSNITATAKRTGMIPHIHIVNLSEDNHHNPSSCCLVFVEIESTQEQEQSISIPESVTEIMEQSILLLVQQSIYYSSSRGQSICNLNIHARSSNPGAPPHPFVISKLHFARKILSWMKFWGGCSITRESRESLFSTVGTITYYSYIDVYNIFLS